jgi:hypothetical protein
VSKVIQAAFLGPDFTEAVLEGRAPGRLTLEELMEDLPRLERAAAPVRGYVRCKPSVLAFEVRWRGILSE